MSLMPRLSSLLKTNRHRNGTVAVLDIGSSKVVCMIAQSDGASQPVIRGIGQHASHGIKRGEVVDISQLSNAVGKAVEAAERMAGQVDQHDAVMRGQQGRHPAPTVGGCTQAVQHQQQGPIAQSLHMPAQARRIHKLAVF